MNVNSEGKWPRSASWGIKGQGKEEQITKEGVTPEVDGKADEGVFQKMCQGGEK